MQVFRKLPKVYNTPSLTPPPTPPPPQSAVRDKQCQPAAQTLSPPPTSLSVAGPPLQLNSVSLALSVWGKLVLISWGKNKWYKEIIFLSQVQVITLGAPQLMKILAFSSLLFSCLLRCTVFYSGIENIILSKNHNNEEENKKNNFTYKQIKQELFKIAFYNYKKRNPSTNLQFKNTRKQKSLLKFAGTKKFHH